MDISTQQVKTSIGELFIGVCEHGLCMLEFAYRKSIAKQKANLLKHSNGNFIDRSHPLIELVVSQLKDYLAGNRKEFDVPLFTPGTPFQESVWKELQSIEYGRTRSYLEQARRLGDEKAIRAVATANGMNRISIFIPCHRVIGSDGSLTGYAGGLAIKKKLLQLEAKHADLPSEIGDQLALFK